MEDMGQEIMSIDTAVSEVTVNYGEPRINSKDPNERKLARKLRIERRWEAIKKQGMAEEDIEEEEIKTPIQQQVQRSAEILEKYIEEGEEFVSNVRVASDAREIDRREAEGIGREKIMEQLQNEAQEAQNQFNEIAAKWSVIQRYNDPLHIQEDIQNQKEKCEILLKQKDEVIAMLREEIKMAERNFTLDQRKQVEDINTLAQRIEKQVSFMRRAYQTEFNIIEEVILAERQNLIDANNRRWEELYKRREQTEVANSEDKFEQLQEFDQKMTSLRQDFQEKFRETKIKLENDIENLQRELEKIKALALINSEKLDYNYQILKKRADENLIIKSQQKRRINKLQDVVTELRKKIADYETSTNHQIQKVSEDIKKLHQSILDVEAKADHFAKVNDEKFHRIWDLNQRSCEAVLKKLVEIDRTLHEQQMGIPWTAPANSITPKTALGSYKEALAIVEDRSLGGGTGEISRNQSNISTNSSIVRHHSKYEPDERTNFNLVRAGRMSIQLDAYPVYKGLLKYLLTQLSDKSGFLTEKRLKEILRPYAEEERALVRLANVFASLGISDKDDIDLLVHYFVPYTFCAICVEADIGHHPSTTVSRFMSQYSNLSSVLGRTDKDTTEILELDIAYNAVQQPEQLIEEIVVDLVTNDRLMAEEEESQASINSMDLCGGAIADQFHSEKTEKRGSKTKKKAIIPNDKLQCRYNHPLLISTVFIMRALREFVTDFYQRSESWPTTGERLEKKRLTISRLMTERDISIYWEKYRIVYDEERISIWDALLEGLKKFHEILKDRKTLCEEVMDLRKQNHDLKRLLSNYLEDGEYMTPPCAVNQVNYLNAKRPPYRCTK